MADKFQRWNDWAPRYIADLMHDLGLTDWQAAAWPGNFAAESGYFNSLQELNPLVKGSRGGLGHAQHTGPRRRRLEAWLKRKGYAVDSYEGNYSYIFRELSGLEPGLDYRNVVKMVKASKTIEDASYIVGKYYEGPAVLNTAPRLKAAKEALELYRRHPVEPTKWAIDKKEVVMAETPKVVVSDEPAAVPAHKSPVLMGSSIGGLAAAYALFETYNPAMPFKDQLPVLWPLIVAVGGSGLAAIKRFMSTAQPITGSQKEADRITATVNTTPAQEASAEVTSPMATLPTTSVPLEQLPLQQLAHEIPRVVELLRLFVPQLAVLGKISEAISTIHPPQPPSA